MKYTLKPTSKFQKDLKRIQKKRSLPGCFAGRIFMNKKQKANIILSAKNAARGI